MQKCLRKCPGIVFSKKVEILIKVDKLVDIWATTKVLGNQGYDDSHRGAEKCLEWQKYLTCFNIHDVTEQ